MVWTTSLFSGHGKAEEATSSWTSIGGVGMGKKMKSVVMFVSAVVLDTEEFRCLHHHWLSKGPQMDHPTMGSEKWSWKPNAKWCQSAFLETCRAGYLVLVVSDRCSSTTSSSVFLEYP